MLSSDTDRPIMSGEASLAGLYELGSFPISRDIFEGYQPAPIHIIPKAEHSVSQ